MNLRYDLPRYGGSKHPQTVMNELGITYRYAIPQSIADQWWFFNCKNVPDPLPEHFSLIESDPLQLVGHGLSKEDAEDIKNHA